MNCLKVGTVLVSKLVDTFNITMLLIQSLIQHPLNNIYSSIFMIFDTTSVN